MTSTNLMFLFSDQHTRGVLGCHGNPVVRTPNLDRLAERGALFRSAYCNAPICVPSRASMATGRHVHEIGHWDNCSPYRGDEESWGHRLQVGGYRVAAIGKLHYRDIRDSNGFDEEILPMHVMDGTGPLLDIVRGDPLPESRAFRTMVANAGGGESPYTTYDRDITVEAVRWLDEETPRLEDKPWALFVSLVCPHPPFVAPQSFYELYPHDRVPWPAAYETEVRPMHPAFEDFRHVFGVREPPDEATVRKLIAAYYGMVTFLDDNIGRILAALERNGLADNTRVVYSSDHGESLGQKGLFSKCNMLEESAGVPLILAGPDVPPGTTVETPVQLVDVFPTIVQGTGVGVREEDADLPGQSLYDIAAGSRPDRVILSEQHSAGARSATFMLRKGRLKYIHYVDYPPQLFDLERDPEELHDVAADPAYREALSGCETALAEMLDPTAVDRRAKAEQARRIAAAGGREAILARGSTGFTPPPGHETRYF